MGYTVALTGGIGSGKSTVADAFAQLGVKVIDADVIARQVVEPGTPALRGHCRPLWTTDDCPRRHAEPPPAAGKIFAHVEEKARLNALLHPLIQQETRRQMQAATSPYLLWVVPLLVENRLSGRGRSRTGRRCAERDANRTHHAAR